MKNMRRRFVFEDTNFIFTTHFAGKKREGDRFPVNGRSCKIIIPSKELAEELLDSDFDVKKTTPPEGRENEFEPEFYINCQIKYKSEGGADDPIICLVKEDRHGREYSVDLDIETIDNLDNIRFARNTVCATLSPYTKGGGDHPTLYVKTLYVKQDVESDPWRARFPRREDLED